MKEIVKLSDLKNKGPAQALVNDVDLVIIKIRLSLLPSIG